MSSPRPSLLVGYLIPRSQPWKYILNVCAAYTKQHSMDLASCMFIFMSIEIYICIPIYIYVTMIIKEKQAMNLRGSGGGKIGKGKMM